MRKNLLITIIIFIAFISVLALQLVRFGDGRLHIVFCDVGQGDAIYIKTPDNIDILIDGGPNEKVLSCLGKHMPFWDKTLELVILTHPHADHLNGLIKVFENYTVLRFATEDLKNTTQGFKLLIDLTQKQNINIKYVYAGDKFRFKDGVVLEIVGPTREFLQSTSSDGFITGRGEFANVETLVKYKDFSALLTGDSQASELEEALPIVQEALRQAQGFSTVSVLQVPHHGSKTGLTTEILDVLLPQIAVISVGKNSFGHPSPEILKILRDKDIKILRTDEKGDIKIETDGDELKLGGDL